MPPASAASAPVSALASPSADRPGLFVSYAHADLEREDGGWTGGQFRQQLDRLQELLTARDIDVFRDKDRLEDLGSVRAFMKDHLFRSRGMLVFYSRAYPERPACQFELITAWIAASRLAPRDERPLESVLRRLLIVNPEDSLSHQVPDVFSDLLQPGFRPGMSEEALANLADAIARRLQGLTEEFAELTLETPDAIPVSDDIRLRDGRAGFVGRMGDMLRLHGTLGRSDDLLRSIVTRQGAGSPGAMILYGVSGQGKTLLAEEYASRFARAWSGGVFRLHVGGGSLDSDEARAIDPDTRWPVNAALRQGLVEGYKAAGRVLGIEEAPDDQAWRALVTQELKQAGLPFLWIIDDLPHGTTPELRRLLSAPSELGATLFTTRERPLRSGLEELPLQPLEEEPARILLLRHCTPGPVPAEEDSHIQAILEALACHALALDVCAELLRDLSLAELRRLIDHPAPGEATDAILNSCGAITVQGPIRRILGRSIQLLTPEQQKLLLLASRFAPNLPLDKTMLARLAWLQTSALFQTWRTRAGDAEAEQDLIDGLEEDGVAALEALDIAALKSHLSLEFGKIAHRSLCASSPQAIRLHPLVCLTLAADFPDLPQADSREAARLGLWLEMKSGPDPQEKDFHSKQQAIAALAPHVMRLCQGAEDLLTAKILNRFAMALRDCGHYQETEAADLRSLEIRKQKLGEKHPATLQSMGNLAATCSDLGRHSEALELKEAVLSGCREILGDGHPDTLLSMANLAGTCSALGRYSEALELEEAVLSGRREIQGEGHPDTLRSMANLAATYADLGRYSDALALGEAALSGRREILGDGHPGTLLSMGNLAATYSSLGRHSEALALGEAALSGRREILGDGHPDTLLSMANLAVTYSSLGRHSEALTLDEAVLSGRREILGDGHPDTLLSMHNLACTLYQLEEFDRAETLSEQAVAGAEAVMRPDHPRTLSFRETLEVIKAARAAKQ